MTLSLSDPCSFQGDVRLGRPSLQQATKFFLLGVRCSANSPKMVRERAGAHQYGDPKQTETERTHQRSQQSTDKRFHGTTILVVHHHTDACQG